jgi:O-acetyl-ADP-ribose deacetylase
MSKLTVEKADITRLAVDAIVNAANERMLGGGGVDGAIHRAAGPRLLEACQRVAEVRPGVRCPTGEARITPGFDLPARFVIHTVGPVFRGGTSGEDALLASCYRSSLELAAAHGLTRIAFPAISCGVYGYPPERAAPIAVGEVRAFLKTDSSVREVILVAFDPELQQRLEAALGAYRDRPA